MISINQFGGGMANDPRSRRSGVGRLMLHFDSHTNQGKLTPHRSYENGDSSSSANKIANFTLVSGTLYGLGTSNGSPDIPKLFTNTDYTGSTWSADAGGYSISGAARSTNDLPFFIYYPKTGKIYGVRAAQYVYSVVPGTSANTTEFDLSAYTTVSNGIIHSKDDILYLGYNNKIAKNDNGSWTAAALTLPSGTRITSICEYGNYLAIAAASSETDAKSVVYLWDRDSSSATLSESIDFGPGTLNMIENIDGYLIGLSQENSSNYFNSRIVLRAYSGAGGAVLLEELVSGTATSSVRQFRQKYKGRVFVPVSFRIGSTTYYATASIGRNSNGNFSIAFERLTTNDSSSGDGVNVQYGFLIVGDYYFGTYVDNAAVYQMVKTDDQSNYTATSVFETVINPGMAENDRGLKKKLVAVAATYEPLPSAGQVVVKYRVEGGSWTTIFTETTDSAVRTSPYVKAGSTEFTEGVEFEFRIESTGGAEVTGLQYNYAIIKNDPLL